MTDVTELITQHDALLADLDGTLYRGHRAVPAAVEAVTAAAARGVRTVYITNNASRSPADVAAHLADLGYPATAQDVVTSAQAAAAQLAEQLEPGTPVLVIGTDALADEVRKVGLAVTESGDDAAAVVQGHSPDTGWRQLAEAAVALHRGAGWVACNLDPTLPTERGLLPGNGSMVAALRTATERDPQVAGKPAPRLIREAVRRANAHTPLVVGDRLDTDVEGGRAAGLPTLLVLTGVSRPAELLTAPRHRRPDYLARDLSCLTDSPETLAFGPRPGWVVTRDGDHLVLDGAGDAVDALRALCAAHWDTGGGPARIRAVSTAARDALAALGLRDDPTHAVSVTVG